MVPNRRKVVASRHLYAATVEFGYSSRSRDVEEHGRRLEGRVLRLRARGAQR